MTRLFTSHAIQDYRQPGLDIHHASPRKHPLSQTPTLIVAPAATLRSNYWRTAAQPAGNDNRATAELLDQFYTCPRVARKLCRALLNYICNLKYLLVEPSAGDGAFLALMPDGSIGFDLDPKFPGIMIADFLTLRILTDLKIAIVGNPPYGTNCDMAVSFFNHGAEQADLIAFVLPRTFRKASVINRLHRSFHLVREIKVPKNAFLFNGRARDVPTVFQIWERRSDHRPLLPRETRHPDFEFVEPDEADFAIQRVGAAAGTVHHNFELNADCHHFIRGNVEHIMKRLTPKFKKVAKDTAGNPSLAKAEIVSIYSAYVLRRSASPRRHPSGRNPRRRRAKCADAASDR